MKIAYLAFGHVDVTLPLINELKNADTDIDLFFCFAQNRKSESVFDFRHIKIPNGILGHEWNTKLIDQRLIDYYPYLQKSNFFIFDSLRIRSLKNIVLTFKLAWKLRVYSIIHASGDSGFLPLLFFILRLSGKINVFTVHDLEMHSGEKESQWKDLFRNSIYSLSNQVILQNPIDFLYARESIKLIGNKAYLLPFGIMDFYKCFLNTDSNRINKSDFLFFGRLSQYKGLTTLSQALQIIKKDNPKEQFSLIIAGSGKDESIIHLSQFENVTIINSYIDNESLSNLIENTKVVICPYTDSTQSGVLMTAFAFYKPVIASAVGGFVDILESYQTGLLTEPSNPIDLSSKMIYSMRNIEKFTNESKKGIENLKSSDTYSWTDISNRLKSLYDSIM